MKTKLIQLSAVAVCAFAGSLIAADQSPAPSSPPSSSPTDTRNPTNPASPSAQRDARGATSAAAADTQFQGKITAVDKESKMVTIQDRSGASKKLHIGDTTKLSKGSTAADSSTAASATWEDLKVGMEIRGTQKMHGSMSHAETVTISSAEAK